MSRLELKTFGGDWDWLNPVINGVKDIAVNVIKPNPTANPYPTPITQPPPKPKFNWTPVVVGGLGLVIIGAVLMKKKK